MRKQVKAPTGAEIKAEIEALRAVLPRVPPSGMMGNNKDAIEAQIAVLLEGLDNDDVYDRFEDKEDPEGDGLYVLSNALDALQWRMGDNDEKPSTGWQGLAR